MFSSTCTCQGIIPDRELIPIKLGKVLLSFEYGFNMYRFMENFVQAQVAWNIECPPCVIKGKVFPLKVIRPLTQLVSKGFKTEMNTLIYHLGIKGIGHNFFFFFTYFVSQKACTNPLGLQNDRN